MPRATPATPATLSALFEVLSHPYRRIVLYYLDEHGDASLPTLAECVTGWVESGPGAATAPAGVDYETVRLELHHVHLPTVADAGFGTYDVAGRRLVVDDLPPVATSVLDVAVEVDAGAAECLDLDAYVSDRDRGDD